MQAYCAQELFKYSQNSPSFLSRNIIRFLPTSNVLKQRNSPEVDVVMGKGERAQNQTWKSCTNIRSTMSSASHLVRIRKVLRVSPLVELLHAVRLPLRSAYRCENLRCMDATCQKMIAISRLSRRGMISPPSPLCMVPVG